MDYVPAGQNIAQSRNFLFLPPEITFFLAVLTGVWYDTGHTLVTLTICFG